MSTVVGTPIFVNMGTIRITDRECWLLLGTDVPGVTAGLSMALVCSLQFTASLYAQLGAALQEYVRQVDEPAPADELAIPFQPRLVRHLRDPEPMPARLPASRVAQHATTILAWRRAEVPVPEIAVRLCVSPSTIWRFLQFRDPCPPPTHKSQLDAYADVVWQMRREGRSYRAIGNSLHVVKRTVWRWCQTHPDPQSNVRSLEEHRRAAR
jgi:hypothetical protein